MSSSPSKFGPVIAAFVMLSLLFAGMVYVGKHSSNSTDSQISVPAAPEKSSVKTD